jgi:HPt (histidine-containing phosphotransfer) domain-containing protein
VDPDTLYATLLKWLSRTASLARAQPAPASIAASGDSATRAASTTSVAELKQRLAGVAGLDIDAGLTLLRGNASRYARMLELFANSHEQDASRLAAALAANDSVTLKEVAHTLKGSAGHVGAVRVTGAAMRLHAVIAGSATTDEVEQHCANLIAELDALVAGIRSAFGAP